MKDLHEQLNENIKHNLKNLRIKNAYTQQHVAEYLGTTQQVYSRYELGINELPIYRLVMLSKLYEVNPGEILSESKVTA